MTFHKRLIALCGILAALLMLSFTISGTAGTLAQETETVETGETTIVPGVEVDAAQGDVLQQADPDSSVGEQATSSVNIENWNFILGSLQPLFLSLLLQQAWSSSAKAIVSFLFTVIVTTAGMYIAGDFNGVIDWATSVLAVFSASIVAYYGLWKPTGVAPNIEARTTMSPAAVPR